MEKMTNKKKTLLVCDLDNTLYDWVKYFVASFYNMVDVAVELMDCDREKLLDDFRTIHQRYHDSEHPFALLETQTVQDHFNRLPRDEVYRALNPAFHAFNSTRKRTLKTHAGVHETLAQLRIEGVTIVAHTESRLFAAMDRLRRLDLQQYFSKIYCRTRQNSGHPDPVRAREILDSFPMDRVIELLHHQSKPDPDILIEICSSLGAHPAECAYVGDSIARDVLMAKRAGVFSIWAAYGSRHDEEEYERLVRISHWTAEDVERETLLKSEAAKVQPDYVAVNSFSEVLDALEVEKSVSKLAVDK